MGKEVVKVLVGASAITFGVFAGTYLTTELFYMINTGSTINKVETLEGKIISCDLAKKMRSSFDSDKPYFNVGARKVVNTYLKSCGGKNE